MLKEICSVEELMMLPKGTSILNKYRVSAYVRQKYGRSEDSWTEQVFRLTFRKGVPHLLGHLGTCHRVKESDFSDDDRYFYDTK